MTHLLFDRPTLAQSGQRGLKPISKLMGFVKIKFFAQFNNRLQERHVQLSFYFPAVELPGFTIVR